MKNTLISHFCPSLKSFIKRALINTAFSVNIYLISFFIIQYVSILWKYEYFLRNVSISIFHLKLRKLCINNLLTLSNMEVCIWSNSLPEHT